MTELLRKHGVVGKFVEFYGAGVARVALYNRATIGNMSPEYGSTCAIFPIDDETLRYLRFTGRSGGPRRSWWRRTPRTRACGTTRRPSRCTRSASSSTFRPWALAWPARRGPRTGCRCAGPRRPLPMALAKVVGARASAVLGPVPVSGESGARFDVGHGDVVIAAITSCTNTSNP